MNYTFDGAAKLLEKIDVPAEHVRFFSERIERVRADAELDRAFEKATEDYQTDASLSTEDMVPGLDAIAARMGESPYTVYFLFLLANTHALRRQYAEKGIADDVFYDTMVDMRCKIGECVECKGVPGTFVPGWYEGIFKMQIFGLGRFVYQARAYRGREGFTMACGRCLTREDKALSMHIPSSGVPLTDEVRFDSYRRAHRFYRDLFNGGPTLFQCASWLLYPGHREFLPKSSNILRFMDDFEIVSTSEEAEFTHGWRVFGKSAGLPPDEFPTDTGLRRAYAERLKSGGKTGGATGVFLFDGEKIVR